MTQPSFAVRGMNTTIYHWRGEADYRAAMAPLIAGGTTTLIVDIGFAQDSIASSQVRVENGEFGSLVILEDLVRVSRDMGFDVWIKPVLFTGGAGTTPHRYQWAALMPDDPDAWFASYGAALHEMLVRVAPYGISAVLLGNELTRVATEQAFAPHWLDLIADVRSWFDGSVGYNSVAFSRPAGLPEEFAGTVFLDALDFIGLSSYPQLYETLSPTAADVEAGWRGTVNGGIDIIASLRAFMSAHPDLDEQALFFDVAMAALGREFGDRLIGVFPFRWGSTTQFGHLDESPARPIYTWDLQGKPAADGSAAWYRGERETHGALVDGTPGADRIGGGFFDDVVRGGRGDDRLDGGRGDDRLHGDGLPPPRAGTAPLEVTASGAIMDGVAPLVEVRANGAPVGRIDVAEQTTFMLGGVQSWNGPVTYRVALPGGVAIEDLRLVQLNHGGASEFVNRNFFIASASLDGIVLSPSGVMHAPDGRVLGEGQAIYADGYLTLDASAYNARVAAAASDDDTLDGGDGVDTAVYDGARASYSIARTARGFEVVDLVGDAGSDRLAGIERLAFSDATFELVNPARTRAPDRGQDPGFLFDGVYYLLDSPELAPAVAFEDALAHYLDQGAAQSRRPNAWFDADYYAAKWPDLTALDLDPATLFIHYNLFGVWEGRSAGPAFERFDGARYLADWPDVAAYVDASLEAFLGSRTNGAIAHFLIYGADERRTAFDTSGAAVDTGWIV